MSIVIINKVEYDELDPYLLYESVLFNGSLFLMFTMFI